MVDLRGPGREGSELGRKRALIDESGEAVGGGGSEDDPVAAVAK